MENYPSNYAIDIMNAESMPAIDSDPLPEHCPSTLWTKKRIQDESPDITVRDGKNILPALIRGKLLDFPVVCWGSAWQYKAEVSWSTLIHCLNDNKPVIV